MKLIPIPMNHCTETVDPDTQRKSDQDRYRGHVRKATGKGEQTTIRNVISKHLVTSSLQPTSIS
jgi:hypothetical protein